MGPSESGKLAEPAAGGTHAAPGKRVREVMTVEHEDIPISDPTPNLPPTAARMLEAAKRVLARDGLRAITFESVAREAGENQGSIRYYFANKAGLITALVDSVMYLEAVQLIEALSEAPAGAERMHALLRLHRDIARDLVAFRMYYELIPAAIRDDELREHFRKLFEWYRALDAWALTPTDDNDWLQRLQPLALLTVALADGVGLMVQADPSLDIDAAFDIWTTFVSSYVKSLASPDPSAADHPSVG